jgi:hypothetical protein
MTRETNQDNPFDWTEFLQQYSRDLLEHLEDRDFERVPLEARNSHWLGYPAATEEEISLAESRLKVQLPPSYRSFLSITNGWLLFDDTFGGLLPVQQIERLFVRNQDFIDDWLKGCSQGLERDSEHFNISDDEYFIYGSGQDSAAVRNEYLPNTIEIGGIESEGYKLLYPQITSSNFVLLDSQIRFDNDEWEAWNFATWYPGAVRYRSFSDMMQARHREILELPKLREL